MTAPPAETRVRACRWLFAIALVGLVFLAYWPGRNGGYAFDDFPNIVQNTALQVRSLSWREWAAAAFSSTASSLQRPVAMLTFAANHYFTGLDPLPMKITNIALHALNALLAYGLLRCLLRIALPGNHPKREWAAAFVALAWALHPINATAVLLVVQRMEVLTHTFVLGGLWAYLSGREAILAGRNGWPRVVLGLGGATCLGILAKESAVLLPAYAFFAEWCLLRFRAARDIHARLIRGLFVLGLLFPLVAGLACLLNGLDFTTVYASRGYTLGERLLTESRVLIDYLQWTLLPRLSEFGLFHDDYIVSRGLLSPPSTLWAVLGIAALICLAIVARRRRPLLALGLWWFMAAHALTATFIPLELVFEHRNYFASLGVSLVLADVLLLAPSTDSTRRLGAMFACVAVVAFGITTWARSLEWSNPYRFGRTEAMRHPNSPRATYGLGLTLSVMSDYRPDSPWLEPALDALERARRVPGAGILPAQALLVVAANAHRPLRGEWWDEIESRMRTRPPGAQEINALATLTRCARDGHCHFPPGRMLALYDAAMAHQAHPDVLTMRGDYELNVLGDAPHAVACWRKAIALSPSQPQYRINLIKLLIAQRDVPAARREIATLRSLGRFGQTEIVARQMEARLQGAQDGR